MIHTLEIIFEVEHFTCVIIFEVDHSFIYTLEIFFEVEKFINSLFWMDNAQVVQGSEQKMYVFRATILRTLKSFHNKTNIQFLVYKYNIK